MKQTILLLTILRLLTACNTPAQQVQTKVYYDMEGFVKSQIDVLTKAKPTVQKTAVIKAQSQQQTTSNINWAHELELFVQADINKPAFKSSYTVVRPDSLTYQYTLKPEEEKLTVRSLTIRLDSITHQPQQVDAVMKTKNPLYESERRLLLVGGPVSRKEWRIRSYQISGFQQLRFFDRNNFSVKAEVLTAQHQ